MEKFICLVLSLFMFCSFNNLAAISECETTIINNIQTLAQTDLTPLDILILDLQDVKRLTEEGDNKTAIVILKSALGEVRKVKEFSAKTKKITEKRIKKGIKLLKQNKNQEALDLLQAAFNALEGAGLVAPGTFN